MLRDLDRRGAFAAGLLEQADGEVSPCPTELVAVVGPKRLENTGLRVRYGLHEGTVLHMKIS